MPASKALPGGRFDARRRFGIPVAAAGVVALVCATLWWLDLHHAEREQRDKTRIALEQVALGLQGSIREHLSVIYAQHELARAMGLAGAKDFQDIAALSLQRLDGLVALRRISARGRVEQSVSRAGRIPLPESAAVARAREHAVANGESRLVPVLILGDRARLLGAFIPYRPGAPESPLLHAIIDVRAMVEPLVSSEIAAGYDLSIAIEEAPIYRSPAWKERAARALPVEREFQAPGTSIQVAAIPAAEPPNHTARLGLLLFGLAAPLATFLLSRRIIEARYHLQASLETLQAKQDELEHITHNDPLTGLPNRLLCEIRLDQALAWAKSHHTLCAVLYIDIDRFGKINDCHGHPVGDDLLCSIAKRVSNRLRESDAVARIGGDDFIVVLPSVEDAPTVARIARELLELITQPVPIQTSSIVVTASIGISLYPTDGEDVTTLLKNADAAKYHAKQEARGSYRFYTTEITRLVTRALTVENRLRDAITTGAFEVYYQPQFCCDTRKLAGVEALLRWHDPELGWVPPNEIIPIAEEAGLIGAIDGWVLQAACQQLRAWDDAGIVVPSLAINASRPDLDDMQYIENLQSILAETGIAPGRVEIELTESQVMQGGQVARALQTLRRCGVRIAVDDFGTGYSSLAYLKDLTIDQLKLDRRFVERIDHDHEARAIARAIISLAETLQIKVVAEGIETAEQFATVRRLGCALAQGYFLGRPAPATAIPAVFFDN